MILHIFNDSLFTKMFIDKSYLLTDLKEHYFIVFGSGSISKEYQLDNVLYMNKSKINLKIINQMFKSSDKILIHSMSKPIVFIIWLSIKKHYLKKSVPIFWGGDLYELNDYLDSLSGINLMINKIRYRCLKRIYNVVLDVGCILPDDYVYFKNHFVTNAQYNPVIYSMDFFDKEFLAFLNNLTLMDVKKETINICIGHSGNKTLKHIETMNDIEKFDNVIFNIPLAYGDKDYINQVKEHIKTTKVKVHVFTELTSFIQYADLCVGFDLIIINSKRQIALGNLFLFLLLEKYVCLPRESVSYRFFTNELGIDIIPYEDLCNQKNRLCLSSFKVDEKKNKDKIMKYLSEKNFVETWKELM